MRSEVAAPAERSPAEVDRMRGERGGMWRVIRTIHRRRPLLTALLVLAAPVHTLWVGAAPADLLEPSASWRFWCPWLLMLFGVAIRAWGSGNLRKNQEITRTGVYQMVRHPLYTGSLAIFLAFFLTACLPAVGVALFLALVLLVYYPTMLGEEEYLHLRYPAQAAGRERLPRLLPNPLRVGEALRTDRFSIEAAFRNLGLRSLAVLVVLPLVLRLLDWVGDRV